MIPLRPTKDAARHTCSPFHPYHPCAACLDGARHYAAAVAPLFRDNQAYPTPDPDRATFESNRAARLRASGMGVVWPSAEDHWAD